MRRMDHLLESPLAESASHDSIFPAPSILGSPCLHSAEL